MPAILSRTQAPRRYSPSSSFSGSALSSIVRLPIAKKDEVKTGKATILATVSGNETREYDIEIEKIYSTSGSTRNLLLHVTDEELLAQTGGVVQGMSGSAILQDGKIIGAVTHVLLEDPSRGYGIFIENMLSAAGLSSE